MACNGQQFSYAQLEGLWINNGGSSAVAPVAAAIAEAESSGCSAAFNPTDNNGTQTSWGLWQISDGTHNQPVANIMDPNVNARAAVAKYNSSGWAPWGTYGSGAYKAYLSGSSTPDTSVPGGSGASGQQTGNPAECALNIGGQHVGIVFGHGPSLPSACLIRKTEVRALMGGIILGTGGMVFLGGVVLLAAFAFRASGAARVVTQVASVVPGVGGVARGARAAGAATQVKAQAQGAEQRRVQRVARTAKQSRPYGPTKETPERRES